MAKQYSLDKLNRLGLKIILSTQKSPVLNHDDNKYYAAYQVIYATGINGNVETNPQSITRYYGAPKDSPWTAKEVGDAIKNFNNLNTVIYNDIKQLYLDLIDEDIQ